MKRDKSLDNIDGFFEILGPHLAKVQIAALNTRKLWADHEMIDETSLHRHRAEIWLIGSILLWRSKLISPFTQEWLEAPGRYEQISCL